jgi:SAM-dependent methyltransferase
MPSFTPEIIARFFRDPDNGGVLAPVEGGFSAGAQIHRLQRPDLLELMPARASQRPPSDDPLIRASQDFYAQARAQTWEEARRSPPWGRLEDQPPAIQRRFGVMRRLVERVLPAQAGSFLDISAGAGAISAALARRYGQAFFADLMSAAAWHLAELGKGLVLRADYLQSPYAPDAFDVILCTDTLIYGRDHEERLLQALWRALAPGGTALLSFHHRWHHNPLTPPVVVGYGWGEVKALLEALAPRPLLTVHKYHQEDSWPLGFLWRAGLPCTRFYVELRKP